MVERGQRQELPPNLGTEATEASALPEVPSTQSGSEQQTPPMPPLSAEAPPLPPIQPQAFETQASGVIVEAQFSRVPEGDSVDIQSTMNAILGRSAAPDE